MKVFTFSLQVIYDHTLALEVEQKKKLAEIDRCMDEKNNHLKTLQQMMVDHCNVFRQNMAGGSDVWEMQQFDMCYASFRELQIKTEVELGKIEAEHHECQQVLIRLMRELQVLEKLREKQYNAYKFELTREAEKEMDDFVSYQQGQAAVVRGLT